MKFTVKQLLVAGPAALLVAAAGVFGLSAVAAAQVEVSAPKAATADAAPADLAAATTARDWTEVVRTRTRPGYR